MCHGWRRWYYRSIQRIKRSVLVEDVLRILDIFEEKTRGWNAVASRAAVLLFDGFAELSHRQAATTHVDECTYDGTDHIAQETVGFDAEDEAVGSLVPMGVHDATVVGLDVGMELGERSEVDIVEEV